jgi:hypothetical protein
MARDGDVERDAVLRLLIEAFFAILPLIVLGMVWPHRMRAPGESFLSLPEWSMTSCVLYGLSLARFLEGAVVAGKTSATKGNVGLRGIAAGYAVLLLAPLFGVILSVVLIEISMLYAAPKRSILNFVVAILCFVILGGYGLKQSERSSETK